MPFLFGEKKKKKSKQGNLSKIRLGAAMGRKQNWNAVCPGEAFLLFLFPSRAGSALHKGSSWAASANVSLKLKYLIFSSKQKHCLESWACGKTTPDSWAQLQHAAVLVLADSFWKGERGDWENYTWKFISAHQRKLHPLSPEQFQQIHPARGSWRPHTRQDPCCSITFCLNFGSAPQKHPYESIPAGSAGSARLNAMLNCLFHSAQHSTAVLAERRKCKSISHESRRFCTANLLSPLGQLYKGWLVPLGGKMGFGTTVLKCFLNKREKSYYSQLLYQG